MGAEMTEDELRKQFEKEFDEQIDDLLGIGRKKPTQINLSLIAKRNLSESLTKGAHDQLIESLMKLTHVRLDRENITEIDNLELLGPVTNLYLQWNAIERIENLECMTAVQFLTLAGNRIQKVENLRILDTLKLLDLSENRIADLDPDELPKSLSFLDLRKNPCTSSLGYRDRILAALPNLKQLDGEMLTKEEKRRAGHAISSDEEEEEEEEGEEEGEEAQEAVDIEDVFRLSADFIQQSRQRAAQYASQHHQHMGQIEEVRSQSQQAMASARAVATPLGSHGDGRAQFTPSPASR